jgi:hypothetical protein
VSRQINQTQPYQDKLVKLIPTEIVGAYMVLAGMIGFGPTPTRAVPIALRPIPEPVLKSALIQIVFFALLVMTPLYLWKVSKVHQFTQIVLTTISFVIWVYTLGGPFVVWGAFYPLVGSVVLVLWSLAIPLFVQART